MSYVDPFFSISSIYGLFQVTSYTTAASEYASWSGDAKDKTSGAKTKKKTKEHSESDKESEDSDSSSNFGKTLKQARAKKAPARKKTKKHCALFDVQWWRVVLGGYEYRHIF